MSIEPATYKDVISDLKNKIRQARQRVSLTVNKELLLIYHEIGTVISKQVKNNSWGAKIIERLASDLKTEFPDFKGLSHRNLKYMRSFAEAYPDFGQQPAAQNQLTENQPFIIGQQAAAQLPWGHHQLILDKVKVQEARVFYIQKTVENGWSRNILLQQIESKLIDRIGKAINNFSSTLPDEYSDLAQQTIKNPYIFDFLSFNEEMKEKELEKALIQHLKKFMLELGKGFAYVGNQKNLVVNGDDFFLDLLFYNFNMHCFVVFELKVGEFVPEFAGKLNFYVNTINEQLKGTEDKPTIGVLLCKTPNKTVIEYSLKGISSPIGVADYQLAKALPDELKTEMPTIEELEKEIEQGYEELKNPSDKKLDQLKELLKGLKNEEVKEIKNENSTIRIFNEVLPTFLAAMLTRVGKIKEELQAVEIGFSIDNHGFPTIEDAGRQFTVEKAKSVNKFTVEIVCKGLKKAGTKAFDIWSGFQIEMRDYKYQIFLTKDTRNPLKEKLYHEILSNGEIAELTEIWFDELLNEMLLHVENL